MPKRKALSVLFLNSILSEQKLVLLDQGFCQRDFGDEFRLRLQDQAHRLQRPAMVFDGDGVEPEEILTKFAQQFALELDQESSVYSQLKKIVKLNTDGAVLIFQAHKLDDRSAVLIDKLADLARRDSLNWSFVLVARHRRLPELLPRRFFQAERIPSRENSRSVKQVTQSKPSWNRWLLAGPVCLALVVAALWLGNSKNTGSSRAAVAPEIADQIDQSHAFANESIEQGVFIGDASGDAQLDDFEQRLREWESFKKPAVVSGESRRSGRVLGANSAATTRTAAQAAVKRMSGEAIALFESNDIQGLLSLFGSSDPNVVDAQGKSALAYSVTLANNSVFDLLLERGAKINTLNSDGKADSKPILLYASIVGNQYAVEKLLSLGANVNQQSTFKKTPLMAAVHNRHYEIANVLLRRNANPNIQDHSGWTALFYATWNKDEALKSLLIEYGADQSIKDSQGLDVAAVARSRA